MAGTAIITTTSELKQLTGSFYANNDFTKVETDIQLETENLSAIIGQPVMDLALSQYDPPEGAEDDDLGDPKEQTELVKHVQLPVALQAAFNFYQSNIVSHEDGGRKVKIDESNEKMAWEWMLDRDDAAQLKKARLAIDRLIRFLDKSTIQEWLTSPQKVATRELLLPNTESFNELFPIDNSPRFYYLVRPFIYTVQLTKIKPAIGVDYAPLLSAFQAGTLSEYQKPLLALIQSAMVLLTIAQAIKRLSVQVIPEGVVQGYKSYTQTLNASEIAPQDALKRYSIFLERDAEEALDEVRKYRNQSVPGALDPVLIPKNDPCNKYFRT